MKILYNKTHCAFEMVGHLRAPALVDSPSCIGVNIAHRVDQDVFWNSDACAAAAVKEVGIVMY